MGSLEAEEEWRVLEVEDRSGCERERESLSAMRFVMGSQGRVED